MRIQITAGGIYGADGKEVPVGTEFNVDDEPKGWAGRYTVVSSSGRDKVAVTNPADPEKSELEKLTIPELKALAETEKTDLKGATAKGDIIAHILKARTDAKAAA